MFIRTLSYALLTVFAAVCALPAEAACPTPFEGDWVGMTQSAVPTEDPDVIAIVTAGEGHGTKLGKFTFVSPHTSRQSDGFAAGEFNFTAADGDQVFALVEGFFVPIGPGVLEGHLNAVIVGGTGRFENAAGQFQLTILFDFATFISLGEYEGEMVR